MWASIVRIAQSWVVRVVGTGAVGTALLLSGGDEVARQQSYPAAWSMSSLARFPWVWTCVRAIADDAGTLPLVAVRVDAKGRRQIVPDPALRLLDQPSTGITGSLFRRQLWIDYRLSGNAYVWRPSAVELIRLHPSEISIDTVGIAHTIVGYWHTDSVGVRTWIPTSQMLHVRDVSWEAGPTAALGESVIRCLHDDLSMELGAKKLAAKHAQMGRPDVVFSSESGISPDDQRMLNDRWEKAAKDGKLAFTVGKGLKVETLSWDPRVFEFSARSEAVRDVVLAAFGVPPARAGLASANYGTQKQQMRTYWESIRAHARAFDDAFSTLAAPGVRIESDFQDVESLQVSYTERQQRVVTWVALGAEPNVAAAYEGFDDAPAMDPAAAGAVKPSNGVSKKPEQPQGDSTSMSLARALGDYLAEAPERYAAIAEAAVSGADVSFLRAWEVARLFGSVDAVLGDHEAARAVAVDVVASTIEAARAGLAEGHDLATLRAFSAERAERLASRLEAA